MKETPSKITNWPDYNRSLIKRGDINLWIDEEMLHETRNGIAVLPPQGKGAPWKH